MYYVRCRARLPFPDARVGLRGRRYPAVTYPKDTDNAARAPGTLETTTDDYAKFMSIADRFTPLQWHNYVPYDRAASGPR